MRLQSSVAVVETLPVHTAVPGSKADLIKARKLCPTEFRGLLVVLHLAADSQAGAAHVKVLQGLPEHMVWQLVVVARLQQYSSSIAVCARLTEMLRGKSGIPYHMQSRRSSSRPHTRIQ